MEIRIRTSGQVMYENEFRQLYPNTSFPQQISADTLNEFGADVLLEGPQASPTRYQTAYRDGVQEIDGKWYHQDSDLILYYSCYSSIIKNNYSTMKVSGFNYIFKNFIVVARLKK